MKWNYTSVGATCLAVGIAGFVAGKVSHSQSSPTESDKLLSRADQVATERMTGNRSGDGRSAATRARMGEGRSEASFDERLTNMEDIIRGENALDRGRAMLSWIDSLAPEEFEDAVARFRSLGVTEARMGEYAMLLTAWAELDPTAALAYTKENTRGGMATGTVLTAWTSRDPESAIAWAKANHEGDDANPYMVGIIRGIVETNPTRATELLSDLPFSRERGQALAAMLPHLMQMGTEAVKGWIDDLGDDRLKDGAIARLAKSIAKDDPEATATWLMANLGDASASSVDDVYEEWAKKDMASAKTSFESLPKGDARSRALRGLVNIQSQENPQSAANLMNSYPEDIDDRMVQHFIWRSFDDAPEVAINQIGLIENAGSQNRMYERSLKAWLEKDKPAAQTWINSANLPENVLKSISTNNTP